MSVPPNPWRTDSEFDQFRATRVTDDGDYFTMELATDPLVGRPPAISGSCFSIAKSHGVTPQVGDLVTTWGKGFGFPIRGVAVAGVVAYYRTAEEDEAQRLAEIAAREVQKRAAFEAAREDHDRRIAALPAPFRERFPRFLAGNPNFRWEFEDYELFVCEEAVKLANAATKAAGAAGPVEWLRAFASADYGSQRCMLPEMSDGHSGNTFGATVALAHAYLTDESIVPKMHGALVYLVGCEAYGCTHEAEQAESSAP